MVMPKFGESERAIRGNDGETSVQYRIRDQEEVGEIYLFSVTVILRMRNASPSRRHLDVATLQDFKVAHRIFTISRMQRSARSMIRGKKKYYILFQLSRNDIREYLHLAMGVLAEAFTRIYAVFVDDSESTVILKLGIIVTAVRIGHVRNKVLSGCKLEEILTRQRRTYGTSSAIHGQRARVLG